MRIRLFPGLVLLFGCLDAQGPQEAPAPVAPETPAPAPAPEGEGLRVLVSAVGATQVRVDDREVYPIDSPFELSEGIHMFVLIGPDGARSQPYARQVTRPADKPALSIQLPPFVPARPAPVVRPAPRAPEVIGADPSRSAIQPMMVRVLVSANGARVRVDGHQEFPVNTTFTLPEGQHTFVLIGENGVESAPYDREVVSPKNKPTQIISLPNL